MVLKDEVITRYEAFVEGTFPVHYPMMTGPERIRWAVSEMCGEAGEVSGVVAKATRKGIEIDRDKILDEASDTLWGVTATLLSAGWNLEDAIAFNTKKLTERRNAAANKG